MGGSKLGCLVFIIIFSLIVYIGYYWGKAQWNYESMKDKINETVKFVASQKNVDLIKAKESILNEAEKIGVDIYEEDIEIKVTELYSTINVYWEVPIEFPGYIYYLQYSIDKTHRNEY